jgi:hypothetical protein
MVLLASETGRGAFTQRLKRNHQRLPSFSIYFLYYGQENLLGLQGKYQLSMAHLYPDLYTQIFLR